MEQNTHLAKHSGIFTKCGIKNGIEERCDWPRGKPHGIPVCQMQIVLRYCVANQLIKSSDVDFPNQVSQALLSLHPQAVTNRPAKQGQSHVKATSNPRQLQIHWGLRFKHESPESSPPMALHITSCQCPRVNKMSK